MDQIKYQIRNSIYCNDERKIAIMLQSGLDPNFEGGWPIRFAARQGCFNIVKTFIQYGANPHLLGESGASTLQLAVFSSEHWDTDKWDFLLSCCDSSQLADGAAVALIFKNIPALKKILATGRCNTNIPTSLTGKTLEQLAKGYKVENILHTMISQEQSRPTSSSSSSRSNANQSSTVSVVTPSRMRINRQERSPALRTPTQNKGNLSPSVARFFYQTANQTALSPMHITTINRDSPLRQMQIM